MLTKVYKCVIHVSLTITELNPLYDAVFRRVWNTPSLPLLPCHFWYGVVVPIKVALMGQIAIFEIICIGSITDEQKDLLKKKIHINM